jgi:hypothetical protein
MSIFSLFSSKAPRPSVRLPEDSGSDESATTQPTSSGNDRKTLRLNQRELLYSTVRDVMIRAGVLAASYRFKVLSLDAQGRKYLIMMDLLRDGIGEMKGLAEIESMVMQAAKVRHDLVVTGVYWRNELPEPMRSRPAAQDSVALAGSPTPAIPAHSGASPIGEPTAWGRSQTEQPAGNKKSPKEEYLATVRKSRVASPAFEDTRILAPAESGSPLSPTQYGDLN